ncbi:MAG: hypothetical protein HFJ38_08040 [Bacilli bacterium]|nr:hypothetical protein [Bacilli bacterium]
MKSKKVETKQEAIKEKGITLIALIITIIVLLILAGVTINLILKQDGILSQATKGTQEYNKKQLKEEIDLEIAGIRIEGIGKIDKEAVVDKLNDIGIATDVGDAIEGEYKDHEFIIDKDYNVTIGEELKGVKPTGIAEVITQGEDLDEVQIRLTASTQEGEITLIQATNGAEEVESTENTDTVKIYKVRENGTYYFRIKGSNGRTGRASCEVKTILQNKVDILTAIKEVNTSGIKKIKVKGKTSEGEETEEKYIFNVIKHQGDMVLDGNSEYEGATITKTGTEPNITATYQFGDVAQDVATTASNYAQNTVVLKVEGNLTINENVTLTSVANASGFGGPKGMVIYCTGNITNNGTISMTARGAKAVGQNVYLYKNADGNFEYIPAIGGAGAAGMQATCPGVSGGRADTGIRPGAIGGRRGTGGGAAARFIANSYYDHGWQRLSGSAGGGSAGTSYSGGTSGGGRSLASYVQECTGSINGGAGGPGTARGAGNPTGRNRRLTCNFMFNFTRNRKF